MWLRRANPWAHSAHLPPFWGHTPTVSAWRHHSAHQALGASCQTKVHSRLLGSHQASQRIQLGHHWQSPDQPEDTAWSSLAATRPVRGYSLVITGSHQTSLDITGSHQTSLVITGSHQTSQRTQLGHHWQSPDQSDDTAWSSLAVTRPARWYSLVITGSHQTSLRTQVGHHTNKRRTSSYNHMVQYCSCPLACIIAHKHYVCMCNSML